MDWLRWTENQNGPVLIQTKRVDRLYSTDQTMESQWDCDQLSLHLQMAKKDSQQY